MNDKDILVWLDKFLNMSIGIIFGILVGLSFPKECKAETDILLGQWSYHYNRDYQFNETHNLVGIDTGDWIVARFKNSYSRTSFTAMRAFDTGWFGTRLAIGASTGYEDIYGYKAVPVVLLNKQIGNIDINFIPIVGITAGFRF